MIGLTPQQARLLSFLRWYIERRGFSPSHFEMRAAIGLNSNSGTHRLLRGLKERGIIRWHFYRPRAIEISADLGALPDWRPSPGIVAFNVVGELTDCAPLRFISADNLRPLNLKQIERAA